MEIKKLIASFLAGGMALSFAQMNPIAADTVSEYSAMTETANETESGKDFVSSIKIIEQTDNSISIMWDSSEQISSYSVNVNGTAAAEKIAVTNYTISGLESASEYFITVSAYDESDNLLLESNELCAHTNLTVTSDYTLTKDISAADVCIKSGTLNLNGYTLSAYGDIWLTNGTLNINKGKLYVGGDFNFSSTGKGYSKGYLSMQSNEDYILVNGNIYVYAYYNTSKLTAGTLEVKGDFTQKYYRYNNNFYCSGSHKVVFSGDKLQNVSFSSLQSQFNTLEVRNFSEGGVVFKTAATVVEIIDNGCNVSFANGERSGWKLENDEVIDGSLNLARGTLDLNGHKLTVTGNLIQSGGNMLVNGGELDVQGDYHIQALNNGSYIPSMGTFTMTDDSDIVKVGGNFLMQSTQSHENLLSAGTLMVAGDLKQLSGGSANNFYTSGTHTVVLNGSKKQTISIYDSNSRITNLKIENTSADGVDVTRGVYISGKLYNTDSVVTNSTNLYITNKTEFPDGRWNYDANFKGNKTISSCLEIGGSIYINSSLTLESDTSNDNEADEYTLMVDGDVWLCSGSVTLNNGKLYVGGNFNICEKNKSYSKSSLNMRNSGDYILVNGDMYVYSTKSGELTAGTLEP